MCKEITELLLEDWPQNDDRHSDAGFSKCDPFFRREDGKASHTMSYQCSGRFDCAMAVGVGFDDPHDVAPGGENPTKLGKIMCERREVDGGDGREECRRHPQANKQESGGRSQTSMISCSFFLITSSIFCPYCSMSF